jgi:hypothetical protein
MPVVKCRNGGAASAAAAMFIHGAWRQFLKSGTRAGDAGLTGHILAG